MNDRACCHLDLESRRFETDRLISLVVSLNCAMLQDFMPKLCLMFYQLYVFIVPC